MIKLIDLCTLYHQVKKEVEQEEFRPGRLGKLQKILWDLFEKPHTSLGARVREREIQSVSLLFISSRRRFHL